MTSLRGKYHSLHANMTNKLNALNASGCGNAIRSITDGVLTDVKAEDLRALNPRVSNPNRRTSDEDSAERDAPQTLKKHSFYRWFKKKLWCIKASSSVQSEPDDTIQHITPNLHDKEHVHISEVHKVIKPAEKLESPVVNTPQEPSSNEEQAADTVVEKISPEKKPPVKERQVTFSDTVKTHIKTKYVTAEELRQIRGMNPNARRIMYHLMTLKGSEETKTRIRAGNIELRK